MNSFGASPSRRTPEPRAPVEARPPRAPSPRWGLDGRAVGIRPGTPCRWAAPWVLAALTGVACFELKEPRQLPQAVQAEVLAARQAFRTTKNAEPLVGAARLYREHGFLFEAADILKQAEDAMGDRASPSLRAEMARTYLALGLSSAVVRELKACLREDRRQPDCLLAFAQLLESDGTPGALREARRAYAGYLEHAPADHPDRTQAEAALERLGGPLPSNSGAPLRLADRLPPEAMANNPHGGAGPTPQAGADAEAPPLNEFGQALAGALRAVREKDFETAATGFRKALEIRPDHPSTLASLAEAEWSLGHRERALELIDRAMALGPDDPQVRFMFGALLLRAGTRIEEATSAWQALLRDQPEVAEQLGIRERLASLQRSGMAGQSAAPGSKDGASGQSDSERTTPPAADSSETSTSAPG